MRGQDTSVKDAFILFLESFKDALQAIFGEDTATEEYWISLAGTAGWAQAMRETSSKYMPEIYALWHKLSWWSADLLDSWIIDCALYMEIITRMSCGDHEDPQ